MKIKTKEDRRQRIKYRIRARVRGVESRPRLSVFRSLSHMYVQVIDDAKGRTIASASTLDPGVRARLKSAAAGSVAGAEAVGAAIAERLRGQGVTRVVFDRNGFLYHGRVKAVADAARAAGLEF
jgi:large subunit ribosomal protein L18